MIAGHREHVVTGVAKPLEKGAGLFELAGSRPLGKIAADDDEVGVHCRNGPLKRVDEQRLVRAEMKVGKVKQSRHGNANAR